MELLQAYNSRPKYSNNSFVPQSFVSLCMLPQAHDMGLACLGRRRRRRGVPLQLFMLQFTSQQHKAHLSSTLKWVSAAPQPAGWPPKLLSYCACQP